MYKKEVVKQALHPEPITESLWGQSVWNTFLKLCSWTVPHGFEESYYEAVLKEYGFTKDIGCYSIVIGAKMTGPMFTAHMDTADHGEPKKIDLYVLDKQPKVVITDGKTILGADDRAGITVLLKMIEAQVPGLYCLFLGEERGCVGSRQLSLTGSFPEDYQPTSCISFDRRGVDSVITHQSYGRCCSDAFALALAGSLNTTGGFNFTPDNTGIYTDSAEFTEDIAECTNISVGYEHEHTVGESQDVDFLERLCLAVVCVDWASFPIERDPAFVEPFRWPSERFSPRDYFNEIEEDFWSEPTLVDWTDRGEDARSWVQKYPFAAADLLEELLYSKPHVVLEIYEKRGQL